MLYSVNMLVRGATELETHVVSVERIKEYTEIQSEVGALADPGGPPSCPQDVFKIMQKPGNCMENPLF